MRKSKDTVVARYDYDPYGRSTTVIGGTPTDFNFTGLYRHSPSNLDLAVRRPYDPDLARWLSRDPIGENGGFNLYAYVSNDPLGATDRLGLDTYRLRRQLGGTSPAGIGQPLTHTFVFTTGSDVFLTIRTIGEIPQIRAVGISTNRRIAPPPTPHWPTVVDSISTKSVILHSILLFI